MVINEKLLRAKIYGIFGSQKAFSDSVGWDINRINKILKGKKIPDILECAEISNALALTRKEYFDIFLPYLSPNGDKSA